MTENFGKHGEKDTPFFQNFPKKYIELPIPEVVLIEARYQNHLFFQVVLIGPPVFQ